MTQTSGVDEIEEANASSTKPLLKEENVKPRWKLTNIQILMITSLLFGGFCAAEIIGALASNSLSLLGDASAMSVDVFTYIANMYAEYLKAKHGKLDDSVKRVLEVYVPTFSVTALLGVTAWITYDAVSVLVHGHQSGDNVDVTFMFAFAAGNFVVDLISSFLFYLKGEAALIVEDEDHLRTFSLDRRSIDWHKRSFLPNLNMISALTHIGSDTMRTTSVFVAATISTAGHLDSDLCDAWAAVIVTCTILLAIIPLCKEIYKAAYNLHDETA